MTSFLYLYLYCSLLLLYFLTAIVCSGKEFLIPFLFYLFLSFFLIIIMVCGVSIHDHLIAELVVLFVSLVVFVVAVSCSLDIASLLSTSW